MNTGRRLLSLLRNRNFLLISALVLGFALGDVARATTRLTLPALALAMTVSVTQISASAFRSWRQVLRASVAGIALTYLLLGGVTLAMARLLIHDPELWTGFVLLAAVPPGVAVIPFAYTLRGDTAAALLGSAGAYLSALAITPLMGTLFAGSDLMQPVKLVTVLLQLLVVPVLLSRLINATSLKPAVERWRGMVVNWSFALIIFTVIGINRDLLLSQPSVLLIGALIGAVTTFGLGFVLDYSLKRSGLDRPRRVSYVLLGTIKNTSLAAATALALFNERTAVPAAAVSAINVLYMVWLGLWLGKGQENA